jgi:phosphate acetyltransferase
MVEFPANRFEAFMVSSIKDYERTIVYIDGEDTRLPEAIKIFQKHNNSKTVLLGKRSIIARNIKESGLKKTDTIEIIEPVKSSKFDDYTEILLERFKERKKEIGLSQAKELAGKSNYYAALMLKNGDADCGVSGSLSSTEAMMRPLIQVIGRGKEKRFLSGAAIQIIPDSPYGLNGQFLFADMAVIPFPDERQLTDIVLYSYETAKALFSGEPKIAMLSYSTKGSAKSEEIDKINRVIDKVKKMNPEIKIDGELQFDAAVIPEVAQIKLSDSEVAGYANVLIFPNLDSSNICTKAIHRLSGSYYYGTIIQGSPIPFNDLSRGCAPVEITTMSIIGLMQRKRMEQA